MENDILFFVKFGKREHLQQTIDGSLRFSPSQYYIELEEKQHKKGQGDLLEGKMKIKFTEAQLYHPDTNKLLGELKDSVFVMAIQDVKNIPVFCLTAGNKSHCIDFVNENKYTIKFNDVQRDTIEKDFPEADSALILAQPNNFINDITQKYKSVSDIIRYYNFDFPTMNMLCTILGVDEIKPNTRYSLTYDNKYRHLLCKDITFKNQNEYRFLILDEYIEQPRNYKFELTSKYLLVSLHDFFNGVEVNINA